MLAGILIHEHIAEDTNAAFQHIYDRFRPSGADKLHITDLAPQRQEALRSAIYTAIVDLGLPCFWYAIHVEGLKRSHSEFQALLEEHKPPPSSRFKRGSPRENPPFLHEQLFDGLFCKVIAFLERCKVDSVAIRVVTDRVDPPTIKRFKTAAERFLDDGPHEATSTAWDTHTKQVVHGSVTSKIHWPDSLRLNLKVDELTIDCVEDGVTLAADVLANSLNYLFSQRGPCDLYGPLNDATAIKAHPIAKQFDPFREPDGSDILGDRLRKHPKAPKSD